MKSTGIGITLAILGIGGFILPFFGRQFVLLMIFGKYDMIAAAIMFALGLVFVMAGLMQNTKVN